MRALVVGTGATGARVARQLATVDGAGQVLLRDIDGERLVSVARSLGASATAETALDAAIVGVDVVVLAVPAGIAPSFARRALISGAHVVAVSDDVDDVENLLALDELAARSGLSVLVGAGFAPGLTCLLAGFGAEGLDEVEEIHVAKVGTGGPACARAHHRALGTAAREWRDGTWVERAGGSGRELCWFPEPVGGRDCYRAAMPDPLLLRPAFPEAMRITARMSATRRDRFTAHLPMMRPPHSEGGLGAVRVEVRGQRHGAYQIRLLGALDRPAVAAGVVAAAAARMAVSGRVRRVGAGGLAELLDPRSTLADLARRGVRVATFEGQGPA